MSEPTFDPDFMTASVTVKYRVMCRRRENAVRDIAAMADRMFDEIRHGGQPVAGLTITVMSDDENIATISG